MNNKVEKLMGLIRSANCFCRYNIKILEKLETEGNLLPMSYTRPVKTTFTF